MVDLRQEEQTLVSITFYSTLKYASTSPLNVLINST